MEKRFFVNREDISGESITIRDDEHLHLSKVLVAQLVSLEVNQHIALQQAVIEYEVNIIILLIEGESSLSLFKKEALAQLQQKLL